MHPRHRFSSVTLLKGSAARGSGKNALSQNGLIYSSPIRKFLVLATVLVGMATACPQPAKAGQWVVDHYEVTGTTTCLALTIDSNGNKVPGSAQNAGSYDWSGVVPGYGSVGDDPFFSAEQGVGNGQDGDKIIGQVTVVLKWSPSGPNDPAPSTAYVKVTGCANAHQYWDRADGWAGWWASPAVNDGFGDAPSVSWYNMSSAGSHLVQVQTTGGYATAGPFNLSANGGFDDEPSDISVSLIASPDNRSLRLQRPGAVGETVDSDGTTHGDTIYSYHESVTTPIRLVSNDAVNTQGIQSVLSGSWGVRSSWNWSPDDSNGSSVSDSVPMPFSSLYAVDGVWHGSRSGPQEYDVTYNCTDSNDGATASSKYVLMVHDAWENLRNDPNNPPTPQRNRVQNPIGAEGPLASAAWNWGVTGTAALSSSLSGNFTASDLASFGISLSGSVSFTVGVNQGVTSPPIPANTVSYPYVDAFWNTNHYLVTHYTAQGLDGTYAEAADDPGSVRWAMGWTVPKPIGT